MEYRLYSKKILNVLKGWKTDDSNKLFGITGDLDNLGVFVSQNGRAIAENLVEVYNHIIGVYFNEFISQHPDIQEFAFLPSGEEIFALGVTKNQETIDALFSNMRNDINKLLKKSPILADYVTISFGVKTFDDFDVSSLLENVDSNNIAAANKDFLDIMLKMRTELALKLDEDKFRNLECEDMAIFFRNCVYSKMREYKTTTKFALSELAKKIKTDSELKQSLKQSSENQSYGISEATVEKLIKLLSNNNQ